MTGAKQMDVVVPFAVPRDQVPMATHFRSTWLTSSMRSLRDRNLVETYLSHLPKAHHEAVLQPIAGVWLPIDVALAHYEACDRLGLTTEDLLAISEEACTRTHGLVFSVVARLARESGVTPWAMLEQLDRMWKRVWVGGAVGVTRVGAKEALVEIASWPCARTPYCRIGLRGVLSAQFARVCSKIYVRDVPKLCTPTSLGYRLAWV